MLRILSPSLHSFRSISSAPSLRTSSFLISARAMSTSPRVSPWSEPLTKPIEELGIYMANIPDFVEGSKRMEIRPQHMVEAAAGHNAGWIVSAGATFASDHDVVPKVMTGSWFLFREENMEKALARLSRDIYVVGGAWDIKKATINAVAIAKH